MIETSKGKGRMKICKDTSQSKNTNFKANLKLCGIKFSRAYIHLAHLLMSIKQNGKTKEESWSENRLQGAELPGAADRRKDQKHAVGLPGHRGPHNLLEEGGPWD